MAIAPHNQQQNPLQEILRGGFSGLTRFAEGAIFGSPTADEYELTAERLERNRLNGSGPVNERAAWLAPKSFTELFFGKAEEGKPGATAAPNPVGWLLLAALAGLAWYWSRK